MHHRPSARYSRVDIEKADKKNMSRKEKFLSTMRTGTKTIKMALPYFWPKGQPALRIRVIICLFLLVLGKVINLFVPLTYEKIIDMLPAEAPTMYILLYGFLRLLSSNIRDIRDAIFVNVDNYATRSIGLDAFKHLHDLSLSFHLTRNTGAVMRTMDRGKSALSTLLSILGFTILPTLLELFLTSGVMLFQFGWIYSIITFMTLVGYIVFTVVITEWRTKYRRAMNETDNQASNTALDSLLNFETVKYFTTEKHELKRYDNALQAYFDVSVKSQVSLTFLNIGQMVIVTSGLVLAMIISAKGVHEGTQTVGELVAINAYIIQLYVPLSWLGTSYRMIINSFTDMENLFDLLAEVSTVQDIPNAPALQLDPEGLDIEFNNITFTYPRRGESSAHKTVIKNVSFKIPKGHTVAIVGHSGSGKTTISRLLCRFYDPDSGYISVNGQDISKVSQVSLRESIGVVPQDTVLFNNTFYYNIEYGSVSLDRADSRLAIEKAAKDANIHDFIMSTPDQYETVVGERGLKVSGGQRQRIAIARTLLKDPPIVILDEATSALDSKTERDIQTSLWAVAKGRTTLVIAHRLSTIVNANEILVMKEGEIVERGTHDQLLELGGEYKSVWELQARESIEKQNV